MSKHKRKYKPKPRNKERKGKMTTDVDMENYLRSPYDPVYRAKIDGRIIGLFIRRLWDRLRGR